MLSFPARRAAMAMALLALVATGLTVASPSPASVRAQPPVAGAAGKAPRQPSAVRVELFPALSLPGHGLRVPAGSRVDLEVRIVTRGSGRTVRLQVATGRWTTVATTRTRRAGTATFTLPTRTAGRSAYRVVADATRDRPAATSRRFRVTVGHADATPTMDPSPAAPTSPEGPADAYSLFDPGRPGAVFRWNPCSPIRYRVNLDGAPPALAGDVTEAIRQLSVATGLTFTYQGTTGYLGGFTDPTQTGWPADTELLIRVAGEADTPTLAGSTVGYATLARSAWAGADARILRAEVILEREFVASASTGFNGGRSGTAGLLLHELGHAVGLGHSSDDSQIMYPSLTDRHTVGYQNGDRTGLARVGSAGGCLN